MTLSLCGTGFHLLATAGEQYGVRSRLQLVLFMRGLIENSTVWIEKSLASLLAAWGRDIWLGNAPGNALSFWSMGTLIGEPQIGLRGQGQE